MGIAKTGIAVILLVLSLTAGGMGAPGNQTRKSEAAPECKEETPQVTDGKVVPVDYEMESVGVPVLRGEGSHWTPEPIVVKFSSVDEIRDYYNKCEEGDPAPTIARLTKEYDDDFFKDNFLIAVSIYTGTQSDKIELASVTADETNINIGIRYGVAGVGVCAEGGLFRTIAMDKSLADQEPKLTIDWYDLDGAQ